LAQYLNFVNGIGNLDRLMPNFVGACAASRYGEMTYHNALHRRVMKDAPAYRSKKKEASRLITCFRRPALGRSEQRGQNFDIRYSLHTACVRTGE